MRVAVVLAFAGCAFHPGAAPVTAGDDASAPTFLDAPPPLDAAPADWWDPSWRWRRRITIVDGAAAMLPVGYQIGLQLDLDASPCTTNRDDIRIVWNKTDLNRQIDEVGTPQWTWFALQAAIPGAGTSTDYWLYCGNPAPPPATEDPKTIFDFFDNFSEASLDSAVWTKMNTVTLTAGELVCGGGGVADSGIVTTTLAFGANHAVDFRATASSTTASDFWAGFQNGTMDVAPWLQWYTHDPTAIAPDYRATTPDTPWYGTDIALDLSAHLYGVENYGTSAMYRRGDVMVESHVYDLPPPAMINVRLWDGSAQTAVTYDMVRVRQAVDPPPTVTTGAPETY